MTAVLIQLNANWDKRLNGVCEGKKTRRVFPQMFSVFSCN